MKIEEKVANAGKQVVEITPQQTQKDQLGGNLITIRLRCLGLVLATVDDTRSSP